MPLLPKQRSSFKTSPKPAQPNLESHLTAPSPQQRAFSRPSRAKYTKNSRKYTTRVDIDLHNWCNSFIAATTTAHPSPINTGPTPPTQARSWHQGSATEVADAMGATASAGSGPVFQKSPAHVVRSTHAERPRASSHQRARPLLCAASLPYPAAKRRTRSKG